jgi:ABC-type dipeptide/oligopeptide/nickel transport system permease subunit
VSITDPAAMTGQAELVDREPGDDLGEARPLRVDVWRRFRRNRLAMVGLFMIVFLVLLAIFAPVVAPFEYDQRSPGSSKLPPELFGKHRFGTDVAGYDVFSRIVFGARVSLKIGFAATAIALGIGLVVGAVAGFFGGIIETLIMRITDIFLAIPYIVLAIAIAAIFGKSENTIILVIGLTGWLSITRIVRASFLSLKQQEYVEAATALGYSRSRIMFRHILPNALQPIIVYGTISVGGVILTEAALSFLGVGPQDPTPAWGLMVAQGKGDMVNAAHLLFFPAAAIVLTVLSFVFIGDGLRDALDPKLK